MTIPSKNFERLDRALVSQGFFDTRARAQAAIRAGLVKINDAPAAKPAQPVGAGDILGVDGAAHPFVSRGGVKLDHALRSLEVDPDGKICLDLGASTGGFTDVLLRAGARMVYAVDVGTGQLHRTLTDDPRVVNLEKTHARDLTPSLIETPVEIIVADVSFISLKKALPPALALAPPGARLVALVKPQFEVGRAQIGKGGIVKPGYENGEGLAEAMGAWIGNQQGWRFDGVIESPIAGGDGNREFLIATTNNA